MMASGLTLPQACQRLAVQSRRAGAGTSGRKSASYSIRGLAGVNGWSPPTATTSIGPIQLHVCIPSNGSRFRLPDSKPAILSAPECTAVARRRHCRVRAQAEEQEQSLEMDEECELVNGSDVRIGDFGAYYVQGIKNNNGLGVLVLSDVLGYQNADTRVFVTELACFGYNVLLPDLFRGVPWTDVRGEDEYEQWRSLHPPERVEKDIDSAVAWLNQELMGGSEQPEKLALVGFCFGGGRLVETLARDEEGRFGAAAFFYGTRFDPALASRIRIPLLLVVGDSDPKCTVETVRQLEQSVPGSVALVYEGAGHAFAHRPSSFSDDAHAVDAASNLRQWLHDHLNVPAEQNDDDQEVEVLDGQGLDF